MALHGALLDPSAFFALIIPGHAKVTAVAAL
jgi:hypothetical protein